MTDQPTHAHLLHLLNRAIDGVVLHGEGDHLRELVCALHERAIQAEAAIERVQAIPLEPETPATSFDYGYNQALRATWAALDQPQQPTTTETTPYWRCAHCADPITGTDWTWAAGQDPTVSVWDKKRFHVDRADCQTAAGNPGQPQQPTAP